MDNMQNPVSQPKYQSLEGWYNDSHFTQLDELGATLEVSEGGTKVFLVFPPTEYVFWDEKSQEQFLEHEEGSVVEVPLPEGFVALEIPEVEVEYYHLCEEVEDGCSGYRYGGDWYVIPIGVVSWLKSQLEVYFGAKAALEERLGTISFGGD